MRSPKNVPEIKAGKAPEGSEDAFGIERLASDNAQDPAGAGATAVFPVIGTAGEGDDPHDARTEEERAAEEAYARLKAQRKARRKKKLIRRGIAVGVVAAIGAGVAIWQYAAAQQAADVDTEPVTAPVTRGPFSDDVTGSGSLIPVNQVVIAPQIEGTVASVNVAAGQIVNEGDVLFTIDNPELDQAVAEAERNVRTAQLSLNEAQDMLRQTKAAAAAASHVAASAGAPATPAVARGKADGALTQAGGIADEYYGGANGDGRGSAADAVAGTSSASEVAAAENQVASAQIALEGAQAALDQARARAAERTVTSPISGSVLELNATPGSPVGATGADAAGSGGGSLAIVADLSQMKVTVQVNEVDIPKIAADQAATVSFSAFPDLMLPAQVTSIASVQTGGADAGMYGGVVTYAVELLVPEPDARLKPGMTASVTIATNALEDVLTVPVDSVADNGDGTGTVMVETDPETHEAEARTVTVLAKSASTAAIEGDIAEGELVQVSGGMYGDMGGAVAGTDAAGGMAAF